MYIYTYVRVFICIYLFTYRMLYLCLCIKWIDTQLFICTGIYLCAKVPNMFKPWLAFCAKICEVYGLKVELG